MVRLDSDGKYTVRALLGAFAQRVDQAVEVDAAGPAAVSRRGGDEQHATCTAYSPAPSRRLRRRRGRPGPPPAEDLEALFVSDGLDPVDGGEPLDGILRQEADARGKSVAAVGRRRGQLEFDDLPEQFDGQLQQDTRAVTTVRLSAGGTAVLEMLQRDQSVGDDLVRSAALNVGDHRDAARVGLVLGVVETLRFGKC